MGDKEKGVEEGARGKRMGGSSNGKGGMKGGMTAADMGAVSRRKGRVVGFEDSVMKSF